jgi:molybdopterin molybdotransferase
VSPVDDTPDEDGITPVPQAAAVRSVSEHRDLLCSLARPLQPFGQHVLASLGLKLCETIVSDFDVPSFDSAVVTGYGVRAADVRSAVPNKPVTLAVVDIDVDTDPEDEVDGDADSVDPQPADDEAEAAETAGAAVVRGLPAGSAVLVAEGSPVPPGVDAVVPLRVTDGGLESVTLYEAAGVGENIRRAGDDIGEGEVVAREGDTVTAEVVGVLAGVGIDRILVRPKPRVVVLNLTPDTVEPGFPLTRRGESYDAAAVYVAAAATEVGAMAVHVHPGSHDPAGLRQVIADQLIRADLLVTVGGSGPGEVLRDVFADDAPDFTRVAIEPSPDHGYVVLEQGVPLVMLPDGLVAAAAGFRAFIAPVITRLLGSANGEPSFVLPAGHLMVPEGAGDHYLPVVYEAGVLVRAGAPHAQLLALRDSTGLAVVSERTAAGTDVTYLPWHTARS